MATNSRIGWRPYVTQVVNAVDADATAFIAAAGITDLTQAAAISTLVNDLKTYGLWTKMKALYPFVGGSAASHKFNLKDPRDLDVAYRLVFGGGWTHTSNGSLPNGTTGYADSKYNPYINGQLNSAHISYYSRTNSSSSNAIDMGALSAAPGNYHHMHIRYTGDLMFGLLNTSSAVSVSNNISQGLFISSRINNTNVSLYRNNSNIGNVSLNSSTQPSNNIYIGAGNITNSPQQYSSKESSFISIGDGLSDTEATNFYNSVQKFQTTLGRHVGTPYVSDPDAIAFLNAAGITDGTQAVAINTLVIRMKADGVWTKMKSIYPFVGGSAASHKFNLKDPRDLDVAYRLVFNGGWTHTSTGSLPNGTTGYADTFLTPTTSLSLDSTHISGYLRTNNAVDAPILSAENATTYNNGLYIWPKQVSFGYSVRISDNTSQSGGTNTDDIRGFHLATRTASNVKKYILNTTQKFSVTTASIALNTSNVYIAKSRNNANYFNNQIAFISIGDGLSDTEAINFYNTVQAYQTTLGRQVNVPLVSDTDAQTFLNAANITSFKQASAVNKLVVDLKAAGVWSKMKAIYPFVGGSAASHKFNLKDPRDLDAAYRLSFNGGWVHSSTGAKPNGTTGYANTFLNPVSNNITTSNAHLSYYSRNINTTTDGAEMGYYNNATVSGWALQGRSSTGEFRYYYDFYKRSFKSVASSPTGLNLGTSISSTKRDLYNNGVSVANNTTTDNTSMLSYNVFIGAGNINNTTISSYSNSESSFASIGYGLTDAEATSLYTAVQTYQTSLGRSVDTPVYNNGLVLNLDAGNANSYPGTGTTWFDLASGNNGTLLNGPTYDVNNGGSILFDGVNDYVDLGSNLKLNDSDITYDFWFKLTDNSDVYREIITIGSSNQSNSISLWKYRSGLNSGKVFANINIVGFTQTMAISQLTGVDILNTIVNYTAVFKKESGVYKLYLYRNGVLDASTTSNVTSYNMNNWTNFESRIGSGSSTYPELWKGNIYSGKVWSRALSATEILNNFNSTRGRFGL